MTTTNITVNNRVFHVEDRGALGFVATSDTSRTEEYNQIVCNEDGHVNYSDYIIHIRKPILPNDNVGVAIWKSLEELETAIKNDNFYIG